MKTLIRIFPIVLCSLVFLGYTGSDSQSFASGKKDSSPPPAPEVKNENDNKDTSQNENIKESDFMRENNSEYTILASDILDLTDDDLIALQKLLERSKKLDQRERKIERREQIIQTMELALEEKISQLEIFQQQIKNILALHKEEVQGELLGLSKLYQSMKPAEAAQIFNDLDFDVLLQIVSKMNKKKAAPILAKMNVSRAERITEELVRRMNITPVQ